MLNHSSYKNFISTSKNGFSPYKNHFVSVLKPPGEMKTAEGFINYGNKPLLLNGNKNALLERANSSIYKKESDRTK